MPYEVTFTTGRTVTVWNAEFLNGEQVRERAVQLHGDRAYRYSEEHGRAVWVDITVPPIARVQQMREVYVNGGYALVPLWQED